MVGRALGLALPIFIAAWYGASGQTDEFFFAYGLVLMLAGTLSPVVESVVVPYVAEIRSRDEDVSAFVANAITATGGALLLIVVAVALFLRPLVRVATDFDEEAIQQIHTFIIIMSPIILFMVWSSLLAGTLNATHRYGMPAISPAPRAVLTVLLIFLWKDQLGVFAIAWAYLTGELLRLALLAVSARRAGLLAWNLRAQIDPKFIQFVHTASYQVLSMVVLGLNPVIDKAMASTLQDGSVTLLHYADRMYTIPVTFFTSGFLVAVLSHWSGRHYGDKAFVLKEHVWKVVQLALLLAFICTVLVAVIHAPVFRALFGHGRMTPADVATLGVVFMSYMIGFTPHMAAIVMGRAQIVRKRTRLLAGFAVANTIIHVSLNFLFIQIYGLAGLALSTSLTTFLIAAGYFFVERRVQKEVV